MSARALYVAERASQKILRLTQLAVNTHCESYAACKILVKLGKAKRQQAHQAWCYHERFQVASVIGMGCLMCVAGWW